MNKNQADQARHRYLNLFQFRFPITAIVSIGHRASGVLMFVLTPVLIYLLEHSLRNPAAFREVTAWMQGNLFRLALLIVLWAAFHHLMAGIRFLLIDTGIGEEKAAARQGAWMAIVAGLLATALSAWILL